MEKTYPPKLCTDCRFYRLSFLDRLFRLTGYGRCGCPAMGGIALVDGRNTAVSCAQMRGSQDLCGPTAKHFEAKPPRRQVPCL